MNKDELSEEARIMLSLMEIDEILERRKMVREVLDRAAITAEMILLTETEE
jgi:hypothetical protein